MKDPRVLNRMEESDLPKLGCYFRGQTSLMKIAWNLYCQHLTKARSFITKQKWKGENPNPVLSLYYWAFMVPVGGSFCLFGWYLIFIFHRKSVKIAKTTYKMNYYQKKAFLAKKFSVDKPLIKD